MSVRLLTGDVSGWAVDQLHVSPSSGGELRVEVVNGLSGAASVSRALAWAHIVHMQSVWKLRNVYAGWKCRRARTPYVIAPRGELDVWSLRQKRLKKALFLGLAGKGLIGGASALHVLNEDEGKAIEASGIPHRKYVLPNGIDPTEWADPPSVPPLRVQFPQIGQRVVVLFFARMHHKKGGSTLAAAFTRIAAECPHSFLVLAGPDYGERSAIERTLREANLQQRSLVLGPQQGESRRRILMDADIVAQPSLQEGHSRVILEGGCLGKALLITPECHAPELERAGAAMAVAPTVEAVAEGLGWLLKDEALRREMGARAAAIIREHYTWRGLAQRQIEIYRQLIEVSRK
jgi:glycosyltransferase involved in cell wall biosynthesis